MSYDENRISDLIDGGLIAKEESQKYTQEEKDFLDKCAIAAMQVELYASESHMADKAKRAYSMAEWMLKARKESLGE